MENKENLVLHWIEKNYDSTSIDIIDYTMPNSKIIRTKESKKILVYWDYKKKQVVESDF
jgi:hypothetical protein